MPKGIYNHLNTKTPIYSLKRNRKVSESMKGKKNSLGIKQSLKTIKKRIVKLKGKKRPPFSTEWRENISKSHFGKKLPPFSEEHKEGISEALKGRKLSAEHCEKIGKGNKGKKLSSWHIERLRQSNLGKKRSEKTRKILSIQKLGKKNHFWVDGRTPENKKTRMNLETKLWREANFFRDNFTCQKCKVRSGNGKAIFLEVHHIYNFSSYPKLRFFKKNGITFCKDCHRKFHKFFGRTNNNFQQLKEFLEFKNETQRI